jgi:SAM-dependent methyltransferase
VYYGLQRTLGSLRRPPTPLPMFQEAASLARWLCDAGLTIGAARVMEVGTGRRVDLPFGLYLAGAGPVHTFDLHRYLKPKLVEHTLAFLRANETELRSLFSPLAGERLFDERISALTTASDTEAALRAAGIRYYAPADASHTPLEAGSIDVHTSYTVFEHIPREDLRSILHEARRLLSPRGVVLHHIDLSDHFYQEDPKVSKINFLQFSDETWSRYADNQFAYHNRLRVHEFRELFEDCGYEIIRWQEYIDEKSLALLRNGFPLAARFRNLPPEVLCCDVVRVLARRAA